MKMNFIPLDYDYFDFEGRNYIRVIGRNDSGKRVCVIDFCDVYLWAILKEKLSDKKIKELIKKIETIKLDVKGRQTCVEKVELHNKRFLEKDVKALKVFATNYKDLHDIANELGVEEIDKRRGYDLGYITHYIIEKKLEPLKWYEIEGEVLNNSLEFGGVDKIMEVDFCLKLNSKKELNKENFNPRILAYDIETDDLKIGGGEILMISLVGNDYQKVITWKKCRKKIDYVEYVEDEAELLEKFVQEVKKFSPDFLVGYFSDGFDLPYLKVRAEKFQVDLNLGLDGSSPKFSRGNELIGKINGIVHIDLLKFIRTAYAQYMQSETLSLNDVANEFLGDRKKEFVIKHSSALKEEDWKNYYEYNLQDSILAYKLFEKFWPDLFEFTRIVGEPIFSISRFGLSKHIENYILHNLNKYNEIPEKQPTYNDISERKKLGSVKGAFVYEPKPGLYEDIAVFDFTSMHTSIIISMNLSKGTLLEKGSKQTLASSEEFERKKKNSFESPEVEDNSNEKYYFSKKPGFFPDLLKDIFLKRKKAKEEYKKNPNVLTKARSNAFKVLSASAHGYIGFFGARYYSHETSASILAFVRKFNKDIIKEVEKEGFNVIFSDTDSVAFIIGNKSKKEIKEFLEKLNDSLPGVMHLELEGFFKRGLWVTTRGGVAGAKKKYAMVDDEGNLKIRGFETVRRDWCDLSREMQNKVIQYILEDGNEKRALEYVKKIIKELKERKVDLKKLIIRTSLQKPITEYKANTPHILAAHKMIEKKIPVATGDLIEYYVAESKTKSKLVRDKIKLLDEEGKYNIEYYLEKQILPAVENIFQVFGIEIKEIFKNFRQNDLKKWF